jgi:hypothetical protein
LEIFRDRLRNNLLLLPVPVRCREDQLEMVGQAQKIVFYWQNDLLNQLCPDRRVLNARGKRRSRKPNLHMAA